MSKPSPAMIDACLTEMRDRLHDDGIDALRVSKDASKPTERLVINENYAGRAAFVADECGIPVTISTCHIKGIAVVDPIY